MKKKLIVLLIIVALIMTAFTPIVLRYGNDKANLSIENIGQGNIYDFHFNTDTCDVPIFSIIDNIGSIDFESFGEPFMGYSDVTDRVYFRKEVVFENGISEEVDLGNGTVLIIENGLIVGVEYD